MHYHAVGGFCGRKDNDKIRNYNTLYEALE